MSKITQKVKDWFGKMGLTKASYARQGIYPMSDWRHVFITSVSIVFILAIFAFYFYTEIDQGQIFTVPSDDASSQTGINKDLMKKTVDAVNGREVQLNALDQNAVTVPDPSL